MSDILYIKIEQNIAVTKPEVYLKDLAEMVCAKQEVVNRLKAQKVFTFENNKRKRRIISFLQVIEWIHDIYPTLEVQNLGETDFIVQYNSKAGSNKDNTMVEYVKVIIVCIIIFFGSAFSMMTFNEDVRTMDIFEKVYGWVMGRPKTGPGILELSYAAGLTIGIVAFFNHVGGYHMTKDPTPIEVEMRQYESQVNTAVIDNVNKKKKETDTDAN